MTSAHRPVRREESSRATGQQGDDAARPRDMRELGRDGITLLVTGERALRAREVSHPTADQLLDAEAAVAHLVARAHGQR
ncbi:MAG: hypothetical protein M0Z51_05565 [Propionibacterium sp.]|nr:hypothetical protein [Propionibacterium sp.]